MSRRRHIAPPHANTRMTDPEGVSEDAIGARAPNGDLIEVEELEPEGTEHWNHGTRVIAFPDGTFVAPGSSVYLTDDHLDHHQIKTMIKGGVLRTDPIHIPVEKIDRRTVDGEPGEPVSHTQTEGEGETEEVVD